MGLDPALMFPADTDASVVQFIALCDPADDLTDMSSHTDLLRTLTSIVFAMFYRHTP